MQRKNWDNFLDYLQKKQKEMFIKKRGQYATEDDVLKNFKQTALMNRETPERSLWGFVSKHINSIFNMIENDMNHEKKFTYEDYEDKAMDVYNYMALLLAIIKEREDPKSLERYIQSQRNSSQDNRISNAEDDKPDTRPLSNKVTYHGACPVAFERKPQGYQTTNRR